MAGPRLTLKLVGSPEDDGFVQLDDFADFCDSVVKCLRRSEVIVSGDSAKVRLRIVDLRCESASVTVEPVREKGNRERTKPVFQFLRDAVSGIQEGNIDPRISPEDLQAFRELTAPLGKTVQKILIGRQSLTQRYTSNIDRLLKSDIISEGTFTGYLDRVNVHNRNEFALYPAGASQHVICVFPESLLETVKQGIKKNVTVEGALFFRHSGPHPTRVNVKTIDIHPDDSQLPSLHDVQALGIWDTGELSALEFVRSIRDEQEA